MRDLSPAGDWRVTRTHLSLRPLGFVFMTVDGKQQSMLAQQLRRLWFTLTLRITSVFHVWYWARTRNDSTWVNIIITVQKERCTYTHTHTRWVKWLHSGKCNQLPWPSAIQVHIIFNFDILLFFKCISPNDNTELTNNIKIWDHPNV